MIEREVLKNNPIENIRAIKFSYPFFEQFVSENTRLLTSINDQIVNIEPVINVGDDNGLGSPILSAVLRNDLGQILPNAHIRDDKGKLGNRSDLKIKVGGYSLYNDLGGRINVSLEFMRLITPYELNEDQIKLIDDNLGLHKGENNIALTSVTNKEVDPIAIKRGFSKKHFDRVIITPGDISVIDELQDKLDMHGIHSAKLSEKKQTDVLIVDAYGIAPQVLQSATINRSIAGIGHSPVEAMMGGMEDVYMIPREGHQNVIKFAQQTGQLILVRNNIDAWERLLYKNHENSSKNTNFYNLMLKKNYTQYASFMKNILYNVLNNIESREI